jgi:hypothetical protein
VQRSGKSERESRDTACAFPFALSLFTPFGSGPGRVCRHLADHPADRRGINVPRRVQMDVHRWMGHGGSLRPEMGGT